MRKDKLKIYLAIFFILFISIFVSLFDFYVSDQAKVLFLGVIISVFSVFVIVYRFKKFGISDPVFIFNFFFLFYNGLVLINFSYYIIFGSFKIDLIPAVFSSDTLVKASLLVFFSYISFLLGVWFSEIPVISKHKRNLNLFVESDNINYKFLIFWSVIYYAIGILMFFYSYSGISGFLNSLSLSRLTRFAILASESSLPYSGFVFTSLALLFYVSFKNKSGSIIILSFVFLLFWAILLLLQGDRRFLIYSILIIVVIWGMIYGDEMVKKFSFGRIILLFILALIGYVGFSFFEKVRFLIPIIITKFWTWSESIAWIKSHISIDWFMPARSEFGAPYFSLLYFVQNKADLLLGSSYLFAIPYLLPRSLYPGVKPTFLADAFSIRIHDEFFSSLSVIKGWGYSPVAEAYQNFGVIGPFLVFFLFGFFITKLSMLKEKGFWGKLFFALIIPELLNFNRMCFAPVFQEAIFILLPAVILYLIFEMLPKEGKNE
ncbi:O-antigen polymerase [Caldisericum sp.]|uniref:O-antigen polymerase n=1 Tax=Caldisericum sp. TaxID=2499687 RepID=UPI003D0E8453